MQVKKMWRSSAVLLVALVAAGVLLLPEWRQAHKAVPAIPAVHHASLATKVLKQLAVKSAASKAGYSRKKFSDGWAKVDTCTIRDKIMARDMTERAVPGAGRLYGFVWNPRRSIHR